MRCGGFDEILKCLNQLSNRIGVPETLEHADVLFQLFTTRMEALDGGDMVDMSNGNGLTETELLVLKEIV
jgi:hypothetical protein